VKGVRVEGHLEIRMVLSAATSVLAPAPPGSRAHRVFVVEAVGVDGTREALWLGTSYQDAIWQAESLSDEFGPVHDLVLSEDGE